MFKILPMLNVWLVLFFICPMSEIRASESHDSQDSLYLEKLPTAPFIDPTLEGSKITYILYARPGGALGNQLRNFWNSVKAKHLDDPAVLDYPPHVTLTGFFPTENPEDQLIEDLKAVLENAPTIIPIQIGKKVSQGTNLDYIPITSTLLHGIAVDFLEYAGVDADFIRPKPDAKLGYHISLREDTNKPTTIKVRALEQSQINLSAPRLQQNTIWAIYLYKKTGKTLEIIYSQPITTQ